MSAAHTITDEQHDGGQGQAVAALVVAEMGHEWHAAGENEAGVDGFIELRDQTTGEVDAQIVLCQVKTGATAMFDETEEAFSWRADPGDLAYWENSNAPVIVMVVRLSDRRAWWRAVDEAFPDEDARARRVVRFDKVRDRFDGAPADVLREVVRRERERRATATRMLLAGPYAAVGLTDELREAQDHLEAIDRDLAPQRRRRRPSQAPGSQTRMAGAGATRPRPGERRPPAAGGSRPARSRPGARR